MLGRVRLDSRAGVFLCLIVLLTISNPTRAAGNIWQSSFGQGWFYEARSFPGEILAGTWWESSLSPGTTYNITFNVKSLKGRIALLVGNNPAIAINNPGSYSFDFNISQGGKRRMLFQTSSSDVAASINNITVTPKWSSSGESFSGAGSSGNWVPKGHYLSFDRERNLKTEMVDPIEKPSTAKSNYHRNVARELHDALTTPGVKGMYMTFNWRTLEVGDGRFNWSLVDANIAAARKYGLKLIVKVSDRSFDGNNVLPAYFPSKYVLWYTGGGKTGVVAKRWDPYVYTRTIRLYKAIANRYAADPGFGGIATTETAMGNYGSSDYSLAKYRTALTQIVTQTQAALKSGRLFFYMNFIRGGDHSDMNQDVRVSLLRDVPHGALVVGGPDMTPDVVGMPRSATAYRIHVRKTMPSVSQFCHMQHVDHGQGGVNVKSNKYRQQYLNEVATIRNREKQWWFKGKPAVFQFDELNPQGSKTNLHPNWVLGKLWRPDELFSFGRRNFNCQYFIWHYRERASWDQFSWPDVQPLVQNNQYF
jgi:hypothetical protein